MSEKEKKKELIFDINEIFKNKNQEEKSIDEIPNQHSSENNKEADDISLNINAKKNIPEEKKKKGKTQVAIIVFIIFFILEMAFTAFMLYNLYYIFNRPSREIDLSGNKYNNTLKFYSASSNLGTINGTALEMFHNVNISNNTRFIQFSKIGLFYPDGTISNNSFRIDTLYTEKLVFTDTNILGRGDFKDSVNFDNTSLFPLKDFNVVEIKVGNFKITSKGVENVENGTIDIDEECNNTFSDLQLLEFEDLNSGKVIGQYNRKLVILNDGKIFLRSNNMDDAKIFEFENNKSNDIEFINFITRNDEIGAIILKQNGQMNIIDLKKELNLPNNIVSASLFNNKSLVYCTDDCHEIKMMRNINNPEKSFVLLNNSKKSKFLAGRLYGGKIIIAASDLINNNNNHNIFVLNFKNPIDISTFGKLSVITDYDPKDNIYNFWLFKNNQTKLIKSIHANTAKASFIHLNHIIIAYSLQEKGTSYIDYDIFNDQLSTEISISEDCFDSFYISHELLSLFGNKKDSDFTLLEKFNI